MYIYIYIYIYLQRERGLAPSTPQIDMFDLGARGHGVNVFENKPGRRQVQGAMFCKICLIGECRADISNNAHN